MINLFNVSSVEGLSGFWLPFIALGAGIVSSFSPCVLPLVPAIIAYVSGNEEVTQRRGFLLSLFFVLGTATVYSTLGLLAGGAGFVFRFSRFWYYLAALISLLMGLKLLGLLKFELPVRISVKRPEARGLAGAFLLGTLFSVACAPCCSPFLTVILSLSATQGKTYWGAFLLFIYSLGFGSLIILAGTLTAFAKKLLEYKRQMDYLHQISGLIFICIGIYFLWVA